MRDDTEFRWLSALTIAFVASIIIWFGWPLLEDIF